MMDEDSFLLESRLDSHDQKLDHLETQMRDLTQVVCSMVETLKKSIEKMSGSNRHQGSHNEPPFQQSLLELDRRMKLLQNGNEKQVLLNGNENQSVSTNLEGLTKLKGEGEIPDVPPKVLQEGFSDSSFTKEDSKDLVMESKQKHVEGAGHELSVDFGGLNRLINVKQKQTGAKRMLLPSVEGQERGNWIVIDSGSLIVHALEEKARAYYNLEQLWTSKELNKERNQSQELDQAFVKVRRKNNSKKPAKECA